MPTGILSLGTIATRLRRAVEDSAINQRDADNLTACADTLDAGWPSGKQLRAIAKVVADLYPQVNTPEFGRCITSLDYWVSQQGTPAQVPVVIDFDEPEPDVNRQANVTAVITIIRTMLDDIEAGDTGNGTFDDLDVFVRTLRRLA